MTTRRPLGPGYNPEHQAVEAEPHRPGRTAAELAADLAADPPAVARPAAPTGRRPLVLRTPEDQAPSVG
ncbi:hypothetical protein ACFWIQ_36300 [Kitasatospora sp. NPDC127059]|uniref:hypothetical protein n=1 Tax=Kitasatospora sp. NPDC127059 TaxID=3347120 RepID=UPI00365F11FA